MRIWGKVQDRMPEWRLVLAGDGYDLQMTKDMAVEMNLRNVEFVGFQDDMTPFYRKASILGLTSQTEGWGLCLTEAKANGVIPVAFAKDNYKAKGDKRNVKRNSKYYFTRAIKNLV
jgi:glycosyltransferase involved in cell wall biosynthesis